MPTILYSLRAIGACIIVCLSALLSACSDTAAPERLDFQHSGNFLAGRLLLPETPGPHPAVLFVHGDGAVPWDAFGYYAPFMQALNKAGFAVYSWDKPGVGDSSGNWLKQSMQDRADELAAAAKMLQRDSRVRQNDIGLMGFSQAGWVMPRAIADQADYSFMIAVSGAINWIEQSEYMTRNRMRLEGASEVEVLTALNFDRQLVELMRKGAGYATYKTFMSGAPACCRDLMSEDRWTFVKRNFQSDAREDLKKVDVPVLALFGDKDLNVDFAQSASVYHKILSQTPGSNRVIILPDADHSLLPTEKERLVTAGPAFIRRLLAIELYGADAFAADAVDVSATWASNIIDPAP
ncbi:alpha/beta hydrolase family protein [Ruegeria meonggei]|uniref:Alpha/beta hydrolase family protein n=1 Tax=Ruegeria meonggei TaxID=1446476 RepID=A0A1X6ZXL5_9RHOB|nr:alpha/beta hydrolase [Ruegeria meonggei]SLN64129.1 Alpha/beta hydrolase family protein [Ruegeria meonggei]